MKDLDKLTKAELKRLLKKTKAKHKKPKTLHKTKAKHKTKTHHVTNEYNQNMSDRMIEQKPIIARTNPLQPVQYMPQGFSGSASMDQRNTDILRGQLNETNNKLITIESKHNNEKEKYEIRNKQSEIEHKRLIEKIKNSNETKQLKLIRAEEKKAEKAKNPLANIISDRMSRDTHIEKNYFKDNDNIDVPATEPQLHFNDDEQEQDVKQGGDTYDTTEDDAENNIFYDTVDESDIIMKQKLNEMHTQYLNTLDLAQLKEKAVQYNLKPGNKQEPALRKMILKHLTNNK
jgi:hypothetical protein